MFRRLTACAVVILSVTPRLSHGSGYEFEGVGARQVARCGAAVADSDDWTSIYWNAANIAPSVKKNGPEVGVEIFGGQAFGKDSNSLSSLPGVGAVFSKDKLDSHFILGAVGALFPMGEKAGIGIGVYTPLLQGADFSDTSATTGQSVDFEGSAGIITTALGVGYQLSRSFSIGAGVNLLYGKLKSDITVTNFLLAGNTATSNRDADGLGLEGVLGLRYDPNAALSFGASYRSGSDVSLKGDERVNNSSIFLPSEQSGIRYVLRHPPTAAVGAAYRPNQRWTHSFDVNRTFWNRFSSAVRYDQPGTLQVNGANTFDWDDTWKLRLGTKFQAGEKNQWLAGYAYDEPALDAGSVDFATTVDVYMSRFSIGWAHQWNARHETVLGILAGTGEREANGVHYRLSGWQLMIESRWTPKKQV